MNRRSDEEVLGRVTVAKKGVEDKTGAPMLICRIISFNVCEVAVGLPKCSRAKTYHLVVRVTLLSLFSTRKWFAIHLFGKPDC